MGSRHAANDEQLVARELFNVLAIQMARVFAAPSPLLWESMGPETHDLYTRAAGQVLRGDVLRLARDLEEDREHYESQIDDLTSEAEDERTRRRELERAFRAVEAEAGVALAWEPEKVVPDTARALRSAHAGHVGQCLADLLEMLAMRIATLEGDAADATEKLEDAREALGGW